MPLVVPSGAPATRILGLGHYRPSNVITNDDLVARGVDTNDEWIRSRVGIAERRWADPDETVVDMAEQAASKALAASGVSTDDVDLVLVATCTMPTPVPAAAPQLAYRLGIHAPGAYDVNSGCSGFVYALNTASAAVLTGQARTVLVVAAERFSGWLDLADRSTCIILADGSGAAVVGASETAGFGPVVWGSDGAQFDTVAIDEDNRFFRQEGQAVYRWATSQMAPVALEACERAGVALEDIVAFVPHQANLRIIEALARRIGLPNAIVARDIVTSGNTSAATIPLAMSRMVERGEIPSGSPVLVLGFGSGLAYAGQVVLAPSVFGARPGTAAVVPQPEGKHFVPSADEIRAGLASILNEVADVKPEDVTDDKSFVDDLDVDSLSMVEVAMEAETQFGVKIPDEKLSELKTVKDAVDYITANAK